MKNKLKILTLASAVVLLSYSVNLNVYAEENKKEIENFDNCDPKINPDCKIIASKTDKEKESEEDSNE